MSSPVREVCTSTVADVSLHVPAASSPLLKLGSVDEAEAATQERAFLRAYLPDSKPSSAFLFEV